MQLKTRRLIAIRALKIILSALMIDFGGFLSIQTKQVNLVVSQKPSVFHYLLSALMKTDGQY